MGAALKCGHGPHRDVQALWSSEHALAWHLGEDFQADPEAWARAQCLAWEELEDQLPSFLQELPDCPCTLAQARADSGRFHVSPYPSRGPGEGEGPAGGSRCVAVDRGPREARLGSERPQGLAPREGMAEPEASPADSSLPLCRRTTAVTLSTAACAPTTPGPCTVCAPCKPGESPFGGGPGPDSGPDLSSPPAPSTPPASSAATQRPAPCS